MKKNLKCILLLNFFLFSCTHTTRIGHTSYPLGNAKKQLASTRAKVLNAPHQLLPIEAQKDTVVAAAFDAAMPKAIHKNKQLNKKATASVAPIMHERIHIACTDGNEPVDTGVVVDQSSVLLRIANISYTVNFISGILLMAFYVLLIVGIISGILGTVPVDLSLAIIGVVVFGLLSFVASIAWLTSSLIFWIKYGKYRSLIREMEETRKKYIYHIVTLILTGIGILITAIQYIISMFR